VSTQTTPHTHDPSARRLTCALSVRACHARSGMLCALSFFALLFSIGCGGGGGSSTDDVASIATAPVDLPPGQTSAVMAWTPSEGEVTGYLVFQSQDEEEFEYLRQVTAPETQITGAPGDSIRILVVARGVDSLQSVASPPSPPVRFHAAAEAATAVAAASAKATAPAATAMSMAASASDAQAQAATTEPIPADEGPSEIASSDTEEIDNPDGADVSDNPDDPEDEVALIDPVLWDRLLRSDARFPHADLSPEASRWIQSFIDAEVGAGVSLAGSGEMNRDALRELVWIDSSGQLFVSDGTHIATSEDLASTFAEAIRLRSTERFAGLADFDGDGIGDWLIEDTATNDVWILDHESHEAIFAHLADENPDLHLVGHGDFDNDGRAELLWQDTDLSFRLGSLTDAPTDIATDIEWISSGEGFEVMNAPHNTGELLSVVDLNGDGRDDLLFRGADGLLDLALSVSDSSGPRFEWVSGPEAASEGLDLVATLDLDQDGAAEIVWWSEGTLEIWEVQTGL
jgi:hypothetical protein